MAGPETGWLVIADLAGYTAFASSSGCSRAAK